MRLDDIAKFVPCGGCLGEGKVMRYPHYCIPMPELQEEICEKCRGKGELLLISGDVTTIRDSSF